MYAVVNHLQFTKSVDDFKEITQNEALPLFLKCPGFIDFHLVKVDEFNAIILITWEDAASAQGGAKTLGPNFFVPRLKPFLVGAEGRSTGEIILSSSKK